MECAINVHEDAIYVSSVHSVYITWQFLTSARSCFQHANITSTSSYQGHNFLFRFEKCLTICLHDLKEYRISKYEKKMCESPSTGGVRPIMRGNRALIAFACWGICDEVDLGTMWHGDVYLSTVRGIYPRDGQFRGTVCVERDYK